MYLNVNNFLNFPFIKNIKTFLLDKSNEKKNFANKKIIRDWEWRENAQFSLIFISDYKELDVSAIYFHSFMTSFWLLWIPYVKFICHWVVARLSTNLLEKQLEEENEAEEMNFCKKKVFWCPVAMNWSMMSWWRINFYFSIFNG